MKLSRYEKLGKTLLREIEALPKDEPAAQEFLESNYYKRLANDTPDLTPVGDLAPFGVSKEYLLFMKNPW